MHRMNQPLQTVSLQFITTAKQGQTFSFNKQCITIGREYRNDLVMDANDATVSRNHAKITYINGYWSIENLSSNNTLTVNQQYVSPQQQVRLNHQDTISLGPKNTLLFLINVAYQYGQSSPQPQATNTHTVRASDPSTSSKLSVPTLEISTNTGQKKYPSVPLTKSVINIGRDSANDVVIDESIISGFHLQIIHENNQLVLLHPAPGYPKTTNGLLHKGRHYKGDEKFRHVLTRGDVFRIGNEFGTLVTLTYNDGSGVSDSVPTIHPIALNQPYITIGRIPGNSIELNHPQVSAHHAELIRENSTYRIKDRGSTNHVYVNGRLVTNQVLKIGDEIRIGPFKLTYTGTHLRQQDESREGIRIEASHLQSVGRSLGKPATILLNDISLSIPPRKFVAVVGGSGAGKSTLMAALNGIRPAQAGDVFYNGQDYYKSAPAFSTQLGYVPQDDIIHQDLTVEKALYYAAKLRLPADFSEEKIKQRIDQVLTDVEMTDRRTLLIKKLSGGQRKRVSIALELLAQPSIFFLDEPTSGLDPGLDRKMMVLLRRLADRGQTIVLVTHATNNIISNCDYVCFLCRGGRLAYFGPPAEAMTFFGQSDFADIYSALEPTASDPDIPKKAEERFKQSADYRKYVEAPLSARGTTMLPALTGPQALKRGDPGKQFVLLSMRYAELLKNDSVTLLILLLQAPVIGLVLVFLINGLLGTDTFSTTYISTKGVNAEKTLFIMAFAAVMFGCINSAREIVKEIGIYRRERTVNLGIAPYLFSKFAVLGVLCLLQSAILVLMVNAASPFHQGIFLPVLPEIYITMALTSLAGLTMGLMVSALVPNNDRAMSFIPLLLIPQVIFSGILFKLDGFAQVLGGLFAARWAMIGMGSSIGLHGAQLGADDFSFHGTLDNAYSQTEATQHLLLAWFMLVLMIVLFACATAYFLKRKDVKMR